LTIPRTASAAPGGEERGQGHVECGHHQHRQDGAAQPPERVLPHGQRTRKTVPSAVRPNTTADGGRCSTAIRMNKNELPQMTDVAAKSTAAFLVTSRAFRYLVG